MRLDWTGPLDILDADGDKRHTHYLVDELTSRCLGIVTEPWRNGGHLLFYTEMPGSDASPRAYVDLDAAKNYCVEMAIRTERNESMQFRRSQRARRR